MKSIFGLNEKIVAVISYAGMFLSGILVYVLEKDNKFVRFHALQSTVTFGALAVLNFILRLLAGFTGALPVVGWLFASVFSLLLSIISLGACVLWVYLIYSAWRGRTFKVPIIGDIVWDKVNE